MGTSMRQMLWGSWFLGGLLLLVGGHLYLNNFMWFCQFRHHHHHHHHTESGFRVVFLGDPQIEGTARVEQEGYYGELNNRFNDLFFRHIVKNIDYFVRPHLVVVLGDLFSSQLINSTEFSLRVNRFRWIFNLTHSPNAEMINLVGNHDIGYGLDITTERVDRFVREFGSLNDQRERFGHLIAVLDSMSLDGSALSKTQQSAWDHLNQLASWRQLNPDNPLILLTHIPLFKLNHSCMDGDPFTNKTKRGFVSEQNMLSQSTTDFILDKLSPVLVFTGHDHEGCEHLHRNHFTREYTVRSMMGDFGGHSLFLEILKSNPQRFFLLSNNNSNNNNTAISTSNPHKQFHIYHCFFLSTALTFVVLAVCASWVLITFLTMLLITLVSLWNRILRIDNPQLRKRRQHALVALFYAIWWGTLALLVHRLSLLWLSSSSSK